jgi:hypothetical protein
MSPTPGSQAEQSFAAWTEAAKATWYNAHDRTDMAAPDAPVTHIVTYRPDIRIRVLIPPWVDPDDWFARSHPAWDDWLPWLDVWTEPSGEALIAVEVLGSTADIERSRPEGKTTPSSLAAAEDLPPDPGIPT